VTEKFVETIQFVIKNGVSETGLCFRPQVKVKNNRNLWEELIVCLPWKCKKKYGAVLLPSPHEYRTRHASTGRLEVLQIPHT
jgi:hypothetical protein